MSESEQREKTIIKKPLEIPKKEIFKLDTAGKFFSFISSSKIPCVYRFWATLKDFVNIVDLQKALDNIIPRFPYYQVTLKKGFSWFYWKKTNKKVKVSLEREYPCQYIPIRELNTIPFRIIAKENQIITEFNHSLTDGMGALTFLKALITEYFNVQGIQINDSENIFRPDQIPQDDEIEYSHRKYSKIGIPKLDKTFTAFHLPYSRINSGIFYTVNGKMDVNEVLIVAKKYNVTLTEFLAAIYIDVLQEILMAMPEKKQRKFKKPIRIMVPINIRNLLHSNTMWNFTAFVAPGIDPRLGEFSFKEIIEQIHHYKNLQMNKKYIVQQISNFVTLERNPFLIATPRFIKRWFIAPIYKNVAENIFSAIMTNLGKTSLPDPINNEVLDIQVLPMNHPYFKTGCALLTYNDELNINFGRNIAESIVEDRFFEKLKEHNINVKITKMKKL
ncbi:MAG: hypothetical protein ACFFDW_10525 [Candidatus Thorarchaeota archaeon]